MVYALVAWIVSAVCVAIVVRKTRRIGRIELPSTGSLVARVQREVRADHPAFRALARAELDELSLEVERETALSGDLTRSLGRIALGTGTALAIFAFLQSRGSGGLVEPAASFIGGFAGAALVAQIGRLASARARHARAHWSDTVARAWARLSGESAHEMSRDREP